MKRHQVRFRVRYAETDQMGVVYHANYLVWMEMGRVEYCRAEGLRYKDFEAETGLHLAVVDVQCRYHHPARYDEEIVVTTSIGSANPRMVGFAYEVHSGETGRLLASGATRHLFVQAPEMKPRRIPGQYQAIFGID